MTNRAAILALPCALIFSGEVLGQNATVMGQVVARDGGQALGFTTLAVPSQRTQSLTAGNGRFAVTVQPGEVRLRFKRIGFLPADTLLRLAPGDTARIRIEMSRLVIQLPEMLVSGKCSNETPREPMPGFLAQLMDQVVQNAERMILLGQAKPFALRIERIDGMLASDGTFTPTRGDTIVRTDLLPHPPYAPRKVMFLITEGPHKGAYGIRVPELADIADTAFINNHCFRYAGRAVVGTDSVVSIEFEPVPWLDKDYDLYGTLYLKSDGYQMVGSFTRLNRLRPEAYRAGLAEYFTEARFKEIVPGIPVLDSWQLTNRYRTNRPSFIVRSRVIAIEWKDSTSSLFSIGTAPPRSP